MVLCVYNKCIYSSTYGIPITYFPLLPLGIIDSPDDSLFSYRPGESWATYFDPFFVPFFEPVFANTDLEARASEVCGDDTFCLFDIAATSRVEIGMSTLEGGQELDEIANFSVPGELH